VKWRTFTLAMLAPGPALAQAPPQPTAVWCTGSQAFSLATGSMDELGLLRAPAERFTATHDARMSWTFAG